MKSALKIATIGLSIGAAVICVVTFRYIRRKRKFRSPKEIWQHVGSLREISLYPIKSSSAVELEEANCDSFGLSKFSFHDRRLVVLNETDRKIASVGKYPLMLSIKIKIISPGSLYLTAPNVEPLTLHLNEFTVSGGNRFIKQMEGYSLELIECLPAQHIWFSRVILNRKTGMRLYLALDPIVETSWWRSIPNELIPIMAMHDKSVKTLNSKLDIKNHVHHHQFRGNLLIQSLENVLPYDEDKWLWLKIGEKDDEATILRFNSPCLRCTIPNIDVFNCKRNKDFEPLRTMRKFRLGKHPKDPEMGIYFDVYKKGVLRCGDPVYVQYK